MCVTLWHCCAGAVLHASRVWLLCAASAVTYEVQGCTNGFLHLLFVLRTYDGCHAIHMQMCVLFVDGVVQRAVVHAVAAAAHGMCLHQSVFGRLQGSSRRK
jgi:hypothetical protein